MEHIYETPKPNRLAMYAEYDSDSDSDENEVVYKA